MSEETSDTLIQAWQRDRDYLKEATQLLYYNFQRRGGIGWLLQQDKAKGLLSTLEMQMQRTKDLSMLSNMHYYVQTNKTLM